MNEFNNRIKAQRKALNIVNNKFHFTEELYGLSHAAIKRWVEANHQRANSELVDLLYRISEKLFFLANKSQEQVSEQYKMVLSEVQDLTEKLYATTN